MSYDAFYPGKLWLDTAGKPIQAHGGSLIFDNGKFYWYGENKDPRRRGGVALGRAVLQLRGPL